MEEETMIAYCVKCKEKRTMQEPQPVFTSNGTPATQGTCEVCGTRLFRMGRTEAHEGLDAEEHTVISKARQELANNPKMVIVESPAKARTVGRFLGKDYVVRASVGHIRDLPANRMGVDVEDDFKPRYVIPSKRKEVVRELRQDVKGASEVYLATDPDREGEAIAWHLVEALGHAIGRRPVRRVEFHEITRDAIEHAFAHPRPLDMQRVDAQQARRILDRLVGYELSPLLREKMGRKGLSAGRVQSVALRLIVEREREIGAFVPVEYWSIEAELARHAAQFKRDQVPFIARLFKIDGQDFELHSQAETQQIVSELERADYSVVNVDLRERRRNPAAPFTTSTLQQEASKRLSFTAKRTMGVAQGLYEGTDVGGGEVVGLITYMRTDSTSVAEVAQQEAREVIGARFGAEYVPPEPPTYKTKSKGAQEAHEAIRPTSVKRHPASLKPYLERDQYRLYDLIWKRFVASQMAPAVMDVTSVDIDAHVPERQATGSTPYYHFRVTGSTVKFPGFLAVYEEAHEEGEAVPEEEEGKDVRLPTLEAGHALDLRQVLPQQHFTQPPPRFSEASLVRALEEYGVGRPSTYAPIMSTIQQRGYVERVDRRLYPTELGTIVNDLLVKHFPEIVDVGFTAAVEEELDQVASGDLDWVPMLHAFYGPFSETMEDARENMEEVRIADVPLGEDCPLCNSPLIIRYGRYGRFIGCSNFPNCRYRRPILVKTGAKCPQCGGDIVEKKTRKGRIFYSCANFNADDPESCKFSTWKLPLPQPCPACGGLLVEVRKGTAQCLACEEEFMVDELPAVEPATEPAVEPAQA